MLKLKRNAKPFVKNRLPYKIALLLIFLSPLVIKIGYTCSLAVDYEPIYLSFGELRFSVKVKSSREFLDPGKVVVKGSLLFVNDKETGIHIINNENPESPQPMVFIEIPGNRDLTVVGDILYADSYVDLVVIDISAPTEAVEISRIENVYPNIPVNAEDLYWNLEIDESLGVVVGQEEIEGESGCSSGHSSYSGSRCSGGISGSGGGAGTDGSSRSISEDSTSTSGSLARMIVSGDRIYLLSESVLKVIDIDEPSQPAIVSSMEISGDIETIYPYEQHLYIGGQRGVRIYSLENPSFPTLVGEYQHSWQCDPIVVQGEVAYVTLRGGSNCQGRDNRLDVLNISNIERPILIETYVLENPYGLAVDGELLFVADGTAGLKVFDVSGLDGIVKIGQFPAYTVHDVIAFNGLAIVIGSSGITQYDYSDPDNIEEISYFGY
ncbi:MAG: hypothetical protein JKY67_20765 [Pseudomonadales bacterium]|nr:hypothetical protein [Pseudomonadales bacterium]